MPTAATEATNATNPAAPEQAVAALEADRYDRYATYALVPILWAGCIFGVCFYVSHPLLLTLAFFAAMTLWLALMRRHQLQPRMQPATQPTTQGSAP
jgi:hypothetical protein